MNWLAHLHLAPPEPLLRIGNLCGDFVRGVDIGELHERLQRGIEHHRGIDRFVDAHPVVRRARRRFADRHRRFAGVAFDVFCDHFLARDWRTLGPGGELAEFVAEVQRDIEQHLALLPAQLVEVWPLIRRRGWLLQYASVAGIERVLRAMSRRGPRRRPLAGIGDDLRRHYDDFEQDFRELWPELVAFARTLDGGAEEPPSR